MAAQFHIGTFFIFAAWVLLVFVSVSVPVWNDLAFLKIAQKAGGGESGTLALGNWGYCILKSGKDACSGKSIGYEITQAVSAFDGTTFGHNLRDALHDISRALILHPIAAGVAFLSMLTALAAHRIGFLFSSLIAFVAAIITLVALALDFAMFAIIKNHVNGSEGPGGASFSTAIWLVLAAFVCLLIGSVTVCCGCFTERRRRAREY